jgi:hypothetical protein
MIRSSQRLMSAARQFSMGSHDVKSHHGMQGPPLKPVLFTVAQPILKYGVYVNKIVKSILEIKSKLQGFSLGGHLAILVDKDLLHLKLKICEKLTIHELNVQMKSAEDVAIMLSTSVNMEREYIIFDSIDNVDGLEFLFVIAVGLDREVNGPYGNLARSYIYRAITRSQLNCVVVNEFIIGGWFEFLMHVELEDDAVFTEEKEKHRTKVSAAKKLVQNIVNGGATEPSAKPPVTKPPPPQSPKLITASILDISSNVSLKPPPLPSESTLKNNKLSPSGGGGGGGESEVVQSDVSATYDSNVIEEKKRIIKKKNNVWEAVDEKEFVHMDHDRTPVFNPVLNMVFSFVAKCRILK